MLVINKNAGYLKNDYLNPWKNSSNQSGCNFLGFVHFLQLVGMVFKLYGKFDWFLVYQLFSFNFKAIKKTVK